MAAVVGGTSAVEWLDTPAADATGRTTFRLRRAEDQLIVDVELVGLEVVNGAFQRTGGSPGSLRFIFGSQHTGEEALDGRIPNLPVAPTTAFDHRSAAPSRIVVQVPDGTPFTIDDILNLETFDPIIDPRAANSGSNLIGPVGDDVTAIELPTDLIISPNQAVTFASHPLPQTIKDVTEVWRVRAGRISGGQHREYPNVTPFGRAIYTEGDTDPGGASGFYLPDTGDRGDLVALLAGDPANKFPIRRLWLSAAGGAFDTEVGFDDPNYNLIGWTQKVVTGRDVFVQILTKGFVLPWGCPATIIEQVERVFLDDTGGGSTAATVYKQFLVPGVAEVDPHDGNGVDDGNTFPFAAMQLDASEPRPIFTEDMIAPGGGAIDNEKAFWVMDVNTGDSLNLPITVTGTEGERHKVKMPVAFVVSTVANKVAGETLAIGDVVAAYSAVAGSKLKRRDVEFEGRPVEWAPSRKAGGGSEGRRSTDRIRLDVKERTNPNTSSNLPAFAPVVERAWIVDDVIAGLTDGLQEAIEVTIADAWASFGDAAENPAGAFLEIVNALPFKDFTGDGGGLCAPSFDFAGISLAFGAGKNFPAIDPLNEILRWDPQSEFSLDDLGGKLLGTIPWSDLLDAVVDLGSDALSGVDFPEVPFFDIDTENLPDELVITFRWHPEDLKTGGGFLAGTDAPSVSGTNAKALIEIETTIKPLEQDTSTDICVDFQNFGLSVPPNNPAIEVGFNKLAYEKAHGKDASTTVDFAGVRFDNALNWLNPIIDWFNDLSDNFSIEQTDNGVKANGQLPIPNISLGVLAISDMVARIGVEIPFDGTPVISGASLGTSEDPFSVVLMSWGGGGYVEVDASGAGIERISAGLIVTWSSELNLVVAKVSMSASIGGGLEYANGVVTLMLFVEVAGSVAAFGISLGINARVDLTYTPATKTLFGRATVVVSFNLAFITEEIKFDVEHEFTLGGSGQISGERSAFGGSGLMSAGIGGSARRLAMPNPGAGFADEYSSTTWSEYCAAFA